MPARSSSAEWKGTLKEGSGTLRLASGRYEGPYTWASRFEDADNGTNPEELVGAAHAGCYAMFLSALLTKAGYPPDSIKTTATVNLAAGPKIDRIDLVTRAVVPGISAEEFDKLSQDAKAGCPISKALAAVDEITLDAQLVD
jgi:osmotically inducible protein OsmC